MKYPDTELTVCNEPRKPPGAHQAFNVLWACIIGSERIGASGHANPCGNHPRSTSDSSCTHPSRASTRMETNASDDALTQQPPKFHLLCVTTAAAVFLSSNCEQKQGAQDNNNHRSKLSQRWGVRGLYHHGSRNPPSPTQNQQNM